jgi:ABC-2 type transport system ATP-binding protein
MPTLEIRHLVKTFGSVTAVDDLSFTVGPGRVVGFLGANGSGKTTTLRCLLGLLKPTQGTATINGVRYRDLDFAARTVGAALTSECFHPGRSARAHLQICALAAGLDQTRVESLLHLVGLTDSARRPVGTFSLGMRQRLALAGALLGDPQVLVLDEPLNGLDPDGIAWVRTLLRDFAAEGRTVLLSSHLLTEIAHTVDDVVLIDHGRLVVADRLANVSDRHVTIVGTPDAAALTTALLASGILAHRTAADRVEVPNVGAETIGRLAAREGVVVTALAEQRDELETVFHRLVNNQETQP